MKIVPELRIILFKSVDYRDKDDDYNTPGFRLSLTTDQARALWVQLGKHLREAKQREEPTT